MSNVLQNQSIGALLVAGALFWAVRRSYASSKYREPRMKSWAEQVRNGRPLPHYALASRSGNFDVVQLQRASRRGRDVQHGTDIYRRRPTGSAYGTFY